MTTCLVNGKRYIGKYEGRETDNYLGSGKLLKRAIAKYGVESFKREILQRFTTTTSLREAEKFYIQTHNASQSDEYYNIAAGGEGGNTFQGIQGKDREHLIEKLKKRKKGNKTAYREKSASLNLVTNVIEFLDLKDFFDSNIHIGSACKGVYVTPFGNYGSVTKLSEGLGGIDYTSVTKKCKENQRVIRKAHLQRVRCESDLTPYYVNLRENIGSTFSEAGYDFIPKEKLIGKSLEYYEKLSILK